MTPPNNWAQTTLGEIADTKLGKMLDAAKNKGAPVPYLRNVNVRWGGFDLSDLLEMRVTNEEYTELAVRDEDIFLCEGGEPGRCAVWRGGDQRLVFQKALHRVRPLEKISPDYISAYIAFSASQGSLSELLTGTTIKHLPQVALQKIGISLPPLAEQRRIFAKLDNFTASLAHARAELNTVIELTRKLRQAALESAICRHSGRTRRLGELLTDVRYGTAQKCGYGSGGTPVLRMTVVEVKALIG